MWSRSNASNKRFSAWRVQWSHSPSGSPHCRHSMRCTQSPCPTCSSGTSGMGVALPSFVPKSLPWQCPRSTLQQHGLPWGHQKGPTRFGRRVGLSDGRSCRSNNQTVWRPNCRSDGRAVRWSGSANKLDARSVRRWVGRSTVWPHGRSVGRSGGVSGRLGGRAIGRRVGVSVVWSGGRSAGRSLGGRTVRLTNRGGGRARSVGRAAGQSAGGSSGREVGRPVLQTVGRPMLGRPALGRSAGRAAGRPAGRSVHATVGRPAGGSVRQTAGRTTVWWPNAWPVGWSNGLAAEWLGVRSVGRSLGAVGGRSAAWPVRTSRFQHDVVHSKSREACPPEENALYAIHTRSALHSNDDDTALRIQ